MDYKRTNAPLNTVTRDLNSLSEQTGNIYETVCVIARRSNQIAVEIKKDLEKKLQEFAANDNMEEVTENREQIEISKFYERLPKPTLMATQEYIEDKLYFSNPAKQRDQLDDCRRPALSPLKRPDANRSPGVFFLIEMRS